MDTIQVEDVVAGADEHTVWVSLGFKSEISPFDVLFIVCAKQKSEHDQRGLDTLYFERFDQAMSCYGGADSIRVASSTISVHFTPLGVERMRFSENVTFDVLAVLDKFANVREHLSAMTHYKRGSIITGMERHDFVA